MLGDSVLIYNKSTGDFFAGWASQKQRHKYVPPKPVWSSTVDGAKVTRSLGYLQDVVRTLGKETKIVSETEARRIEAMRKYGKAGGRDGRGVEGGAGTP